MKLDSPSVKSTTRLSFKKRYSCSKCGISFSKINSYRKHVKFVHETGSSNRLIKILILGGGFAGIEVLKHLQKKFQNDITVDITLVSKDNFFLFTPMLPEVVSGNIETRHIATPIRSFCNRARFFEAQVESINFTNKEVKITHFIGKQNDQQERSIHFLKYDYLVVSLGGEVNFFGNSQIQENAFTLKSLGDAIILRNHIISMLEQSDIEHENIELKNKLMTFVIVGAGFSGVETAGELNYLIKHSVKHYYPNINEDDVKIILLDFASRLLPETTNDLSEFALQKLEQSGVKVILNTKVVGATKDSVILSPHDVIDSYTLIWTGGVKAQPLISELPCSHDKSGRLVSNNYLQIDIHKEVYAIGDCASVINSDTGVPHPPTAQIAVRQARTVVNNIIADIKSNRDGKRYEMKKFQYKTRGMMALVGKRNGVGIIFGKKIYGFLAWWLWHSYYLRKLPITEKRIRVMVDWTIDLFFKRDVTKITYYKKD